MKESDILRIIPRKLIWWNQLKKLFFKRQFLYNPPIWNLFSKNQSFATQIHIKIQQITMNNFNQHLATLKITTHQVGKVMPPDLTAPPYYNPNIPPPTPKKPLKPTPPPKSDIKLTHRLTKAIAQKSSQPCLQKQLSVKESMAYLLAECPKLSFVERRAQPISVACCDEDMQQAINMELWVVVGVGGKGERVEVVG